MSASAGYDTKEQVRQATDIVELVGSYIQLRRQGRGYVGLCPWHDDSRPSLQVNPERQSWKCWVCDIGGDVFNFIMQREGVDFREALKILAERAGIELTPSQTRAPAEPGSPDDKQTLYRAMAWAEQQFHQCLMQSPEAEPARRYLLDRGFHWETIERFHLGFSPDQWQWLLDRAKSTPFSAKVLEAVGLVAISPNSGRPYDRFKGRLMFSIRDTQNRPIANGGRVLPETATERSAKYINSPETRLFSKSDQLYALDVARDRVGKSREVIVVEGYTDAIMAHQCSLENVVAVLGTALGPRHVRLLRRYADTITLVLDGDEAGQKRTSEILELFVAEQVDLRILTLPEGLDPCDFLNTQGGEAFRSMCDGAVDALEHKILTLTHGLDVANDTHRANRALEEILATLAKSPRLRSGTTTQMRLREHQVLSRLARQFHVDETELRSRLTSLRRRSQSSGHRPDEAPHQTAAVAARLDPWERELLEILIQQPEAVAMAAESISCEQLTSGPAQAIFSKYRELTQHGVAAEFTRLLTELEDPGLKSLLVKLEEDGHAKGMADWELRLKGLIADFQNRQQEAYRRGTMAAMEDGTLDEEAQLKAMLQMHEEDCRRQRELDQ